MEWEDKWAGLFPWGSEEEIINFQLAGCKARDILPDLVNFNSHFL